MAKGQRKRSSGFPGVTLVFLLFFIGFAWWRVRMRAGLGQTGFSTLSIMRPLIFYGILLVVLSVVAKLLKRNAERQGEELPEEKQGAEPQWMEQSPQRDDASLRRILKGRLLLAAPFLLLLLWGLGRGIAEGRTVAAGGMLFIHVINMGLPVLVIGGILLLVKKLNHKPTQQEVDQAWMTEETHGPQFDSMPDPAAPMEETERQTPAYHYEDATQAPHWKESEENAKRRKKNDAAGCVGCLGVLAMIVAVMGLLVVLGETVTRRAAHLGSELVGELNYFAELFEILELSTDLALPVSLVLLVLGLAVAWISYAPSFRMLKEQMAQAEGSTSAFDRQVGAKQAKYWRCSALVLKITGLCWLTPLAALGLAKVMPMTETTAVLLASLPMLCFGLGLFILLPLAMIFYFVPLWTSGKNSPVQKEQMIYAELRREFSDLAYNRKGGMDPALVLDTKLLRHSNIFRCNDYIRAGYRGMRFHQADVHTSVRYRSGGKTETRTVFHGRWMTVELEKSIPGQFYLYNKKFDMRDSKHIQRPGMQHVEMEDSEFNQYFDIYAENPHDVFYILTPALMDRLKTLSGLNEGRTITQGLGVCCEGNRIHFAVSGLPDAFEFILMGAVNEAQVRARVQKDMSLITDLIDTVAPSHAK